MGIVYWKLRKIQVVFSISNWIGFQKNLFLKEQYHYTIVTTFERENSACYWHIATRPPFFPVPQFLCCGVELNHSNTTWLTPQETISPNTAIRSQCRNTYLYLALYLVVEVGPSPPRGWLNWAYGSHILLLTVQGLILKWYITKHICRGRQAGQQAWLQ